MVSVLSDFVDINLELVGESIVINDQVSWVVLIFHLFVINVIAVGKLVRVFDIMAPEWLSSLVDKFIRFSLSQRLSRSCNDWSRVGSMALSESVHSLLLDVVNLLSNDGLLDILGSDHAQKGHHCK